MLREVESLRDRAQSLRIRPNRSVPTELTAYALSKGISLTGDQLAAARSVLSNTPTIVHAAHGVGKSLLAALLACWFFETHPHSIGLITAPVNRQIGEIIFKEMRRILRDCPHFAPKANSLFRTHDWWVNGYATSSGDAFQGKHSAGGVLILFDECTGIDQVFWDRAKTMAVANRPRHYFLGIGNPYTQSSPMYMESQTGLYNVIRMSALTHPNVVERREVVPGAVTHETVLRRLASDCREAEPHELHKSFEFEGRRYVAENPMFSIQILGDYPSQSDYSLWSDADLESLGRPIGDDASYRVAIGCDVARYGTNATVMCVRRGPNVVHMERHMGYSVVQTAARLKELANKWQTKGHGGTQVPIMIDGTGIGGGVCDLRGTGSSTYNFIEVHNGGRPSEDEELYVPNLRSELWIRARDLARNGKVSISMLPQKDRDALVNELRLPRFSVDNRGRTVLEKKEQISRRLGTSPDLADAFALACMVPKKSYESHF